jgi:hypothetical protein
MRSVLCFDLFVNIFVLRGKLKLKVENKYVDKHSIDCMYFFVSRLYVLTKILSLVIVVT